MNIIHRLAVRAYLRLAVFTRGMTMGVRAIAVSDANAVFLVRHTYVPGWHLPGGAIDPGEDALTALAREMAEEGNLVFDSEPQLLGVYLNRQSSSRDHVVLYAVSGVSQTAPRAPDREIAESGFFQLDRLPEETTRATLARIAEWRNGVSRDAEW
jgi:ADP-ribose pyrophosphatase YjhB (NUDIX family)